MVGHRVKALRLTPQRLHDGVNVGWQLAYFADQALERPRGGWPEDLDKPPRPAWRTACKQGQACAHHTESREPRANARQVLCAFQQAHSLLRHRQPFRRRIDEYDAGHTIGMTRCMSAHDEAAERVSHQNAAFVIRNVGDYSGEFVNDAIERARTRRGIAPGEPGAVVSAHAREGRDPGLHERPAQRRRGDA
jgi:hypothetical protein